LIGREALNLNNHYKCMEIGNMSNLKEVLVSDSTIKFLQTEQYKGVVGVVAMTNGMEPFASWNSDKWDGFLRAFLNSSLNVITIACVCDKESFGYLMAYVHKSRFATKFIFECGYYEPEIEKLPFAWSTMMETLMLSYGHLFPRLVGIDGVMKVLGSERLCNTLKDVVTKHREEAKVYSVEVRPKA